MERLDKIMSAMSDQESEVALNNHLPYIFTKAEMFMRMGAEKYRKGDFFKQPDADYTPEDIDILKTGCKQILDGKGFSKDKPLKGLGVFGFSGLMLLFHFEKESRVTDHSFEMEGKRGALDAITFRHLMDERRATLYNFCEYDYHK